jgi:hypothetical protein
MNLKTLPEFQKHLIRHRLGEGIIIRAIANEVNVSTNTVLLPKEMFVSITRGIFVICHHNIVNLFVSKPELNGANLPNLNWNCCHFVPVFFVHHLAHVKFEIYPSSSNIFALNS